jgi:hypothetical protein
MTGKPMLRLVKIQSLRKIEVNLYQGHYEFLNFEILQRNVCWWAMFANCSQTLEFY